MHGAPTPLPYCLGRGQRAAGHQDAQAFFRRLLGRKGNGDVLLVEHGNAVGKGKDLLQVLVQCGK